MPVGQFEQPSPNKLIAAYQKLANKQPVTAVNRLKPSSLQSYQGTFQQAEAADANLSQVQLQGGAVVRFVPKLSNVGSLSPGDVVLLHRSGSQILTIVGKVVGNINLATTQANVTPPTAPTSLHTTAVNSTSVTVAWNASTDYFGSGLKYNIFLNNSFKQSTSLGATTSTISGLKASTSYSCYVTATDGAGNTSNKSNTINFTTDPAPAGSPGTSVSKVYKATSLRTYNYNGHLERDAWLDGLAYQGSDQSGGYNSQSLIFFNYAQMQSDLAGHTPTGCTVKVTYAHWWYNSGGTAYVGFHGYTSIPSHTDWYNYEQGIAHASSTVGKQMTFNFGATHAEHFASGHDTGIAIGPAPGAYPASFSPKYYGYTYGAGSHIPTITLTWTV